MATKSSATTSRRRELLLRLLAISAAAVVALAIAGAVAFYFFQGWRARDLADKALRSLADANYRAAWLQVNSARGLRPDDPAVLRASAIIESRFGMPTAMDYWERLAERTTLSPEDLEERGRASAALGDDAQFDRAVEALDAASNQAAAGRLRTVRSLARGNMDRAIEEARRAIAATDDPAMKLDLARLLLRRHVDRLAAAPQDPESQRIVNEIFAIVDSLQGTTKGEEALAFGLTFLLPGQEKQGQWVDQAFKNMHAANPALLPAATVMVDLGKTKTEEMHGQLRPIFDAAPLTQRAAFVSWLTRQGMPREGLTLITAQEAGENTEAFVARTEALGKMGNWAAVVETANAGGKAPLSVRLATRARAEYELRQQAQSGANTLADALRAAAIEGGLPQIIAAGDKMGGQRVVDMTLVELCGDPAVAADAFRLTRDRLSRRGASTQALLADAHARATTAAPNAVSVQDYARYVKLLTPPDEDETEEEIAARKVDPDETAAAVAAAPNDPAVRATHALALLQAGRPQEALGTFDDLTLFFARVPPGLQAVLCRVLFEGGQTELAENASETIDVELLTDQELSMFKGKL